MRNPNEYLLIEKSGYITKITNESELDVIVSIKPIKPKRKYVDMLLVPRGQFLVHEVEIDLSRISISFVDGHSGKIDERRPAECGGKKIK